MKFTKHTLENGLRVVTLPMSDTPAVTVMVMVEAGSKYETKDTNGISHFLEHMVFKGTPSRPKATAISKELDGLGAESNAFTGDEYTGYYAKVAKKHYRKALEIVSDMYLNPLFDVREIEKEKGVIIEEIRMYQDRPERQVRNALNELLYAGTPAGWTVLGPEENIRSFTKQTLLDYRDKHYTAKSTVVVVAGDIKEDEVVHYVDELFHSMSTKDSFGKVNIIEEQSVPGCKIVYKDTTQTHLSIGIRTFSFFDPNRHIMRVLGTILGGGMSSWLFAKMRDDLGICYYIHAGQHSWTDHGFLGISAGVDTTRVELALATILEEVSRMKTELVSDEELQKAKEYIAGHMMLGLETSDDVADYAAHLELLRKEITLPEDTLLKIQAVTAEDIRNLARKYFVDERLNLAMIGPYKDSTKFKDVLHF